MSKTTTAPDPYDTDFGSAFDHAAFYTDGMPYQDETEDTGLRCYCEREVVATDSRSGWSHIGVGDKDEMVGEA